MDSFLFYFFAWVLFFRMFISCNFWRDQVLSINDAEGMFLFQPRRLKWSKWNHIYISISLSVHTFYYFFFRDFSSISSCVLRINMKEGFNCKHQTSNIIKMNIVMTENERKQLQPTQNVLSMHKTQRQWLAVILQYNYYAE